ncbi:MAG: LamG domain-containing protein, partial [Planctomycetota bacterium]
MTLKRQIVCACLAVFVVGAHARADLVCHWPLDGDFLNIVDPNFDGYLDMKAGSVVKFTPVEDLGGVAPAQKLAAEFTGVGSWIQTDYPGIEGASPRTFTAWIKTGQPGQNDILGYGVPVNTQKFHLRVNNTAGNGLVGAIRTEYQGGQNVGTDLVDDGIWHHVAVVFPEGATIGAELIHYVDGVVQGRTGNGKLGILSNTSNPLYHLTIGLSRQSATSNRWYVGQIADVRVYDHGLTAQNIVEVMNDEELTEPTDCSTLEINCEASKDGNVTATLTTDPDGCTCAGVEVAVNGEARGSAGVV